MTADKIWIKSAKNSLWAQALTKQVATPLFPQTPSHLRPYLLALLLFATTGALMFINNAALLRYGLPWTLVSLLVIVAAAHLWGVRPAVLVLALSLLYGVAVIPALSGVPHLSPSPTWQTLTLRTGVFLLCGLTTVWLTYRARQMQESAECRREVVLALRSMILPDKLTPIPGYDIGSIYRPSHRQEEVGGDFYDIFLVGEGRYGVLMGDVMGHGKEAAASTALLRYSLRALASRETSPAQILGQLDGLIDAQEMPFATASLFVGILDSRSGSLCYANAGHEPPMLKRADGAEETLNATGPILGTRLSIPYQEKTVVLSSRDVLFLMTDGVTEARNAQGVFLEKEGVWHLLRTVLPSPSAQQSLTAFDKSLTAYIGTCRCDDIAMLLLCASGNLHVPRHEA